MNYKKILVVLLVVVLLVGLGFSALMITGFPFLRMGSYDSVSTMDYPGVAMDADNYEMVEAERGYAPDVPKDDSVDGEKKIWRGDMRLKVERLEESIQKIEEKAVQLGGFVSDSYVNHREKNRTASITLRVPVKEFGTLMTEVGKVGELESSSSSSQEVTRQYIDLEARIKNLTAQESRLLEILEMGETVEEILMVERELQRIRGEIEVLTADFNYLKNQVDLSTLTVYLTESALASPGVTSPGLGEIISNGYRSLINNINMILIYGGEFIIFTMGAIPFLVLLALAIGTVVLVRRRRGSNKTPPPAA